MGLVELNAALPDPPPCFELRAQRGGLIPGTKLNSIFVIAWVGGFGIGVSPSCLVDGPLGPQRAPLRHTEGNLVRARPRALSIAALVAEHSREGRCRLLTVVPSHRPDSKRATSRNDDLTTGLGDKFAASC